MEYNKTVIDPFQIRKYSDLLLACFPMARHFTPEYLRWLYAGNPDGAVVGFDAWDGDRLAGHYVCIPAMLSVNGADRRALLSLNTATHPDYRGQGLFTKLAERTYSEAVNRGFECVYGVSNANSTPGFVRRLGFNLVGQLDAKLGIGRLTQREWKDRPGAISLQRKWDARSLAWRFGNPVNPVGAVVQGTSIFASASARVPGLVAWSEIPQVPGFASIGQAGRTTGRLFLGKLPPGFRSAGMFLDIPTRLRPSPLNLIFRDLVGRGDTVEMASVFLSFLDFDAY